MKYYIKDQDLHWYIKHVIKCVIYLYIFMEKILPLIWSFLFFFLVWNDTQKSTFLHTGNVSIVLHNYVSIKHSVKY